MIDWKRASFAFSIIRRHSASHSGGMPGLRSRGAGGWRNMWPSRISAIGPSNGSVPVSIS